MLPLDTTSDMLYCYKYESAIYGETLSVRMRSIRTNNIEEDVENAYYFISNGKTEVKILAKTYTVITEKKLSDISYGNIDSVLTIFNIDGHVYYILNDLLSDHLPGYSHFVDKLINSGNQMTILIKVSAEKKVKQFTAKQLAYASTPVVVYSNAVTPSVYVNLNITQDNMYGTYYVLPDNRLVCCYTDYDIYVARLYRFSIISKEKINPKLYYTYIDSKLLRYLDIKTCCHSLNHTEFINDVYDVIINNKKNNGRIYIQSHTNLYTYGSNMGTLYLNSGINDGCQIIIKTIVSRFNLLVNSHVIINDDPIILEHAKRYLDRRWSYALNFDTYDKTNPITSRIYKTALEWNKLNNRNDKNMLDIQASIIKMLATNENPDTFRKIVNYK